MLKLSAYMATAATAALIGLGAGSAMAQSGPEYFNGKTVNFIVATDPGGGYDTYGRLVAEFMQKHLPGSTFVVRNMPGAGHLIATNFIYASEPDGLTMGTFNTGLIYGQLTEDPGVQFDLTQMSWIGKVASDPRAIMMSTQSGIESWEDLINSEERVRFASAGVASAATVETRMLVNVLDLPVDLITGYQGNEGELAMRRGEVQGQLASRSSVEPFVRDGHAKFIVQMGGDHDDVPQLSSLVDDEDGLRAISLVESQVNVVRLIAAPPGIPEEILTPLQEAFRAAVEDPEFLERAEALGLPIDPLVGDEVGEAIREALDQTPEMIAFLKEALAN